MKINDTIQTSEGPVTIYAMPNGSTKTERNHTW